jgi:histidine phosphotransferase ChpT
MGAFQMGWRDIDRVSLRSAFNGITDRAPAALPARTSPRTDPLDLRVLELLTARLCHELIGPIAAINNGVELLADEPSLGSGRADTHFVQDTISLVGDSASRASSRLQFYRFAYGHGPDRSLVGLPPRELARRFFNGTQIACDYGESTQVLPLDWQRLACNLLLIGAEVLSRGGNLILDVAPDGLDLAASGETASLSRETGDALLLATPVAELTPRSVQAYFTGLLARGLGCRLVQVEEIRRLRLTAVPLAG